jgi:hypothetical protein
MNEINRKPAALRLDVAEKRRIGDDVGKVGEFRVGCAHEREDR